MKFEAFAEMKIKYSTEYRSAECRSAEYCGAIIRSVYGMAFKECLFIYNWAWIDSGNATVGEGSV
jgi:hypothetical protein